jgi:hypothetical protein
MRAFSSGRARASQHDGTMLWTFVQNCKRFSIEDRTEDKLLKIGKLRLGEMGSGLGRLAPPAKISLA